MSNCSGSEQSIAQLTPAGNGVWTAPGARIIDRTGRKMLPIGQDGFVPAAEGSVLVDKTALIADVLDSGYKVTLFCRPRRFGKTLNMTMLKAFFEAPAEGDPNGGNLASLFEGTEIWEADGGRYRAHQGAYPVVYLSLRTAKGATWEQTYGALRGIISTEYSRHDLRGELDASTPEERLLSKRILNGSASDEDLADSLLTLCRMLKAHYRKGIVLLIDEYDAPVMAGYSAPDGGYYREVVDFMKRWLTGALKDGGEVLAFGCLTGVQRISKESIFSDLNNLTVSTSLSTISDERFGFTDAEVAALAAYLGRPDCMDEARRWYDCYRFGRVNVYNPWSVLNYLDRGCTPGVYWTNTSSNEVVGQLVRSADEETLSQIYGLLEPGGYVAAPLDLGIVFPDVGIRTDAIWSMLYLAGYLTTDLTEEPDNNFALRPLRIPNREIAQLFKGEVIDRFRSVAGGSGRLSVFHRALCTGDAEKLQEQLAHMAMRSGSTFDFISENSCHLFLLGLCFGVAGYRGPVSNREEGLGRCDIRLEPIEVVPGTLAAFGALPQRPLVTIEVKFQRDATDEQLHALAQQAIGQIAQKAYDEDVPPVAAGRLRWGIAFSGKQPVVACEQAKLQGHETPGTGCTIPRRFGYKFQTA